MGNNHSRETMESLIIPFFAAALLSTVCSAEAIQNGTEQKAFNPDLKAGDYVWQPKVSPEGPVAIIVSLSGQTLYVYRNGLCIGRSTVSSGKAGHRTPTGVFTILEKNEMHHSSKYHNASMPFMERLTWDGVAIHAGNLPGYPESHGCVHVPLDFAKKLYTVTEKGTTVLVTDDKAAPGMSAAQPGLLFSVQEGQTLAAPASDTAGFLWKPEAAPAGPVSILFSSADKQIYVYRNGVEIGRAAIGGADAGRSYGSYVYAALAQKNPDGSAQWNALGSGDGSPAPDIQELKERLIIPAEFLAHVRETVTSGTTLVITDHPVNQTTRSGPSFTILNTSDP